MTNVNFKVLNIEKAMKKGLCSGNTYIQRF